MIMKSMTTNAADQHGTADAKALLQGSTSKRSNDGEIRLTKVFILVTLVASLFATNDVVGLLLRHVHNGSSGAVLEQSSFIFIVAFVVDGNLVYQFTRRGYL